jgi:DNA-binding LytR/AlgR family response regulator
MNIMIIEDEPKIASLLKEFILSYPGVNRVSGVFESIEKSVSFLNHPDNQPNLVFMDIQLADGICFEIFSRATIHCPVVFCTANEQYTLQAFKSNGIEYILKPFDEQDVHAALDKMVKFRQAISPDEGLIRSVKEALMATSSYRSSLLIRFRDSYIPIAVDKIAILCLENSLLYAYTIDHQKYPVYKTIDEMEQSLDPKLFFRINRQMLLNRTAVSEIKPYFNRKVFVKTLFPVKDSPVVSRLKVAAFLRWIEQA